MLSVDPAVPSRRQLFVGAVGAVFVPSFAEVTVSGFSGDRSGPCGFDFLHGRWTVRHRKLAARLVGSRDWVEFPGTLDVRPILGGSGNIDENVLEDPTGTYLASSIRLFIPSTDMWSIYWADSRSAGLDKPVTGRFSGSAGEFFNDDELGGRPIRVRFTYEDLGPNRARWSQAFSPDAGVTWETNWIMDFTREGWS